MKLLNLNIGIKLDNNYEVVKLISDSDASIVTLQKVMRGIDDSVFDLYNSASIIKKNTTYPYSFFGPLWVASHHEKNGVVSRDFGGLTEQGNYILSRYPCLSASNIFYHKHYGEFSDTTCFRVEDHPRAFTKNILEIEGGKLLVINVHGIWTKDKLGDDRTLRQVYTIIDEVEKMDLPTIIVGDFNLLLDSSSIAVMDGHFRNLIREGKISSTRPSFDDGLDEGDVVCDYVFVNDKIEVTSFQVIRTTISDHFPLLLEFEILDV